MTVENEIRFASVQKEPKTVVENEILFASDVFRPKPAVENNIRLATVNPSLNSSYFPRQN